MKKRLTPLLLVFLFSTFLSGFFSFSSTHLENIKQIARSCYLIQSEYYDTDRIVPIDMLKQGFHELAKEAPEVLPLFNDDKKSLDFFLGSKKTTIALGELKQLYDILPIVSQAFEFIRAHYNGEAEYENMEYAFIAGMLSQLDPHSSVMPPKVFEEFKTTNEGSYGGIGIVIGLRDRKLTVISPMEGTPAYKVGMKAKDHIMEIDGQSTQNMNLTDAVDLMKGTPKTKVTLKVKSKNRDPRLVTIVRDRIVIKYVIGKAVEKDNKLFGILRVKLFQEDTINDVEKEIARLIKEAGKPLDGYILDLRNNPGGLLDQAIRVSDKFLPEGDIVFTVGSDDRDLDQAYAKNQRSDIKEPLVVLINQGSASASEILAGALKNNDRATVIGQTSFGKGSVQALLNLRDGASLKLTVSQYLTAGRQSIQAVGIAPDIHIFPSAVNDEYYDLIEDIFFTEKKLDHHLKNQKYHKEQKTRYELTYLDETNPDELEERNEYSTKIDPNDFALKLALEVLEGSHGKKPSEALPQLSSAMKRIQQEEQLKIQQALKKRSIDWSKNASNQKPNLAVSYRVTDANKKTASVFEAGQTGYIEATVTNTSNKPAYQVISEIEALNPLVNNKEFVFGKVNPGQKKTVRVAVKTPAEISTFEETVKLRTQALGLEESPLETRINTRFVEKTPPQFAYQYKLIDNGQKGSVGNGNGVPESGETIVMEVTLKNIGAGHSEKTSINLKNTEGKHVYLTQGHKDLGVIKSQKSKTDTLKFEVKKSFTKKEFSIDFFALDENTRTILDDSLKFKNAADASISHALSAPKIVISDQTRQLGNELVLNGTAVDSKKLKDIAIFATGKKLAYYNFENQKNTKQKNFELRIPLEEGINSVVIQARGERNLTSRKSMSVVYEKPQSLAQKKSDRDQAN